MKNVIYYSDNNEIKSSFRIGAFEFYTENNSDGYVEHDVFETSKNMYYYLFESKLDEIVSNSKLNLEYGPLDQYEECYIKNNELSILLKIFEEFINYFKPKDLDILVKGNDEVEYRIKLNGKKYVDEIKELIQFIKSRENKNWDLAIYL